MKQFSHVENTLFSAAHPFLYKQISTSQLLKSSLVALVGAVVIVGALLLDNSQSALCMTLLIIGFIFLLYSFYRFFSRSYETVYKPTGSVVRMGSLYMDTVELQIFQQMLKKNDFLGSSRFSFKEGGNGRLDYLVSKDGRFVALQLFQFVPYAYEAVSEKYYYTDDIAVTVAHRLNI